MSIISCLRFFGSSKEECLLSKAIRNEPLKPPKDVILKIQEHQKDIMSSQLFNHQLFARFNKILQPNEYIRILCVFYNIMKVDIRNCLITKLVSSPYQFITKIPDHFTNLVDKEVAVAFANALDWRVTLFSETDATLEERSSKVEVETISSDNPVIHVINSLSSMFLDLSSIQWDFHEMYDNQLTLYVLSILIRELATVFYKLCLYTKALMDYAVKAPANKTNQIIKLLTRFDEIQKIFVEVLTCEEVRIHFPEVPLYKVEISNTTIELLLARCEKSKINVPEVVGCETTTEMKEADLAQINKHLMMVNQNFQTIVDQNLQKIKYFTQTRGDSSPCARIVSRSTSIKRRSNDMPDSHSSLAINRSDSEQEIHFSHQHQTIYDSTGKANRRISVSSSNYFNRENGEICHYML
ncbi:Ras-GAP domain-containing protein [Entamoeba marina]